MKVISRVFSLIICLSVLTVALYSEKPVAAADNEGCMLHVSGNQIFDSEGHLVRLMGANLHLSEGMGSGKSNIHEDKIFERLDLALNSFNYNCVRVPVYYCRYFDEDLADREWYRGIVDRVIEKTAACGKYVVLDYHGDGSAKEVIASSLCEEFWSVAAVRYKNNPNVIFGIFNEPRGCTWDQWLNGTNEDNPASYSGNKTYSKGMQYILNLIRSTGAKNVVTAGGINFSADLAAVANGYALKDPNGNGVIYEAHIYPSDSLNHEVKIGECAKIYPVYIGELGPVEGDDALVTSQDKDFMAELFDFINKYDLSFTAWCFVALDGPNHALLKYNSDGSFGLTGFGEYLNQRIAENIENKDVTLKNSAGKTISLAAGNYSYSQLSSLEFDITTVTSFERDKAPYAYLYSVTFYSGEKFDGKCVTVYNESKSLKNQNVTFKPKSVVVTRELPKSILHGSTVTVSGSTDMAENLTDGKDTYWMNNSLGPKSIVFDLGKIYNVYGVSLAHALSIKMPSDFNTKDFSVQVSTDGNVYKKVAELANNDKGVTTFYFAEEPARYIKIYITKGCSLAADPEMSAIVEVEAYGTSSESKIKQPVSMYVESVDNSQTVENAQNNVTEPTVIKKTKKGQQYVYVDDYTVPIIIGISAGVLLTACVTVLIVIKKKRKNRISEKGGKADE